MSPRGTLLTKVSKKVRLYLIAQTGSTLQQGLPSIFIDNQSSNLWRNGSFGRRLWTTVSSRWAFLIVWGGWQTFWSGWRAIWSFYIGTIIIQSKWGDTLAQAAAFGLNLKCRFIDQNNVWNGVSCNAMQCNANFWVTLGNRFHFSKTCAVQKHLLS